VGAATAVGPDWPVRLDASHTVEVTGDATRLRQVVDNLLANVRAHTPRGTTATVRVGAREGLGVIEVADNGPGFPAETGAQVFERFYRADPSRSRQNGGAGLGLAIVAAIVAAHGGTVAATATPGGGATFTVWLPTNPSTGALSDHSRVDTGTSPYTWDPAPAGSDALSTMPQSGLGTSPAAPSMDGMADTDANAQAGSASADNAVAPAIASDQCATRPTP
jgi:hypothetical protein